MIIICPNEIKDRYLKNKGIHNYKFYTLNEIKEKALFKFKDNALYEVSKKYNVKPEIASRILNSLYFIDGDYNLPKLKKLLDLKEYLVNQKLIIFNNNFLKSLKDEIIIEGYPRTKEFLKIINLLSKYTSVTYNELKPKYELKNIYEFDSINLEITFVAENILDLISSGVDINKIYIINYNDEYKGIISRIFTLFKIPFSFKTRKKITMFKITKEFLNFIKTSDLKISELDEFINSLKGKNDQILNQIVNVLNKYYSVNEPVKNLYDVINFDLKNTYLKDEKYNNVINILNGITLFDDDEYVFSISNNESLKYKDNDYLKDIEKSMLNLDTSYELNIIDDLYSINILSNIKNLTLSYKLHNGDNEYVVSHNFEDLNKTKYQFKYNSSNYNKYLFSNYKSFDNSYRKIDFDDLKAYLDDKLNISYSSMEVFFKCKFRFFLNNILKLEPTLETMSIKVGNMFHKILERTIKNNYENYLEIIDEEVNNYLNGDVKEKFYGTKLKKEAIKIIERLKENSSKSDFKEYEFEKYFELPIDSKINLKLVGFADKVLIFNDGINNYIIVIDYKTGTYNLDLSKVKDGFNMQLLIYLYLITKTNYVLNPKIAGAYIDHILDDLKSSEYGKKYEDITDNKLDGITIKDHEVLKHIDNMYDVSSYIKGIRVKTDGDFHANAKVYSEKDFNKLFDIVEDNIKKIVDSIENCDFEINPKRYLGTKPDDIIGCEFCPYKEVCYVSGKDIKALKKTTLEEMLGDLNELDN